MQDTGTTTLEENAKARTRRKHATSVRLGNTATAQGTALAHHVLLMNIRMYQAKTDAKLVIGEDSQLEQAIPNALSALLELKRKD